MPYDQDQKEEGLLSEQSSTPNTLHKSTISALGATLGLSACGGETTSLTNSSNEAMMAGPPAAPPAFSISETQAARFLLQASMGATREQIKRVQTLGYSAWLDEQFSLLGNGSRWDWLVKMAQGVGRNDQLAPSTRIETSL